jgi:hypothetical protein
MTPVVPDDPAAAVAEGTAVGSSSGFSETVGFIVAIYELGSQRAG